MNIIRKLRNYFFYCGIEKNEYDEVKKEAYISNYRLWRILHFFMIAIFAMLFIGSFFNEVFKGNRLFYLIIFVYFVVVTGLFFVLKEDSIAAQLLIYLSISVLFLFGCMITQNKPDKPSVTFIVMLLITPMFMIDKPFFMGIELSVAAAVFSIWMYNIKPYETWQFDFVNVITYTIVGIFLNVIANSIRIKEFVLTREINIQKDTDELTGLKNKGALTREINEFLTVDNSNKGIMLLLDIDKFKAINDTYGHDVGDKVIIQLGNILGDIFTKRDITGRFGGDEFIVFIKDIDDRGAAKNMAADIIKKASEGIELPDKNQMISISVGIAIYNGVEKNYSEIFKKADKALYTAKDDPDNRFFCF